MPRPGVIRVRDMNIMIISAPQRVSNVRTVPSNDVDDSKVVKDEHAPPKAASIIENISVSSETPIVDEVRMSSDSTSDDVNEIVEVNIPTEPGKSIEFLYAEYSFIVVPTELF